MAITYVTGAPGAGKTLWTIQATVLLERDERKAREKWIKEHGTEEGAPPIRQVFYRFPDHVADVDASLGWKRVGKDCIFHELQTGAICIVDEAWELWPQRKAGSSVPPVVEQFATHRHRGHDFFVLTQRVSSVDHFIRGLVSKHVHLDRQFGLPRSHRLEWQRLGDPSDKWDRDKASHSEFIFPKDVYKLYKSSDMHTVKTKLPWLRLALIPALMLGIAVLGYRVYSSFSSQVKKTDEIAQQVDLNLQQQTQQHQEVMSAVHELRASLEWAQKFTERVPGEPASASIYDAKLVAATLPKIQGCMRIQTDTSDTCRCNTQQGTIITTITPKQCVYYLHNGWFDPTAPDIEEQEQAAAAGAGVAAPPAPAPQASALSSIF